MRRTSHRQDGEPLFPDQKKAAGDPAMAVLLSIHTAATPCRRADCFHDLKNARFRRMASPAGTRGRA
jgi:hypothetical protein